MKTTGDKFREDYEGIWGPFTKEISGFTEKLITHAEQAEEGNLHDVLSKLQSVSYDKAPNMFDALGKEMRNLNDEKKRSNIGSVTGVFFELIVASLVTGYMRRHFQKEAKIELNSSGILKAALQGSRIRDADIHVSYRNRHVVFETKVSPKQNEINSAERMRNRYIKIDSQPTAFFLIGGRVDTAAENIKLTKDWACYTSGSEKNKALLETYTLDNVLKEAVSFLRGQ